MSGEQIRVDTAAVLPEINFMAYEHLRLCRLLLTEASYQKSQMKSCEQAIKKANDAARQAAQRPRFQIHNSVDLPPSEDVLEYPDDCLSINDLNRKIAALDAKRQEARKAMIVSGKKMERLGIQPQDTVPKLLEQESKSFKSMVSTLPSAVADLLSRLRDAGQDLLLHKAIDRYVALDKADASAFREFLVYLNQQVEWTEQKAAIDEFETARARILVHKELSRLHSKRREETNAIQQAQKTLSAKKKSFRTQLHAEGNFDTPDLPEGKSVLEHPDAALSKNDLERKILILTHRLRVTEEKISAQNLEAAEIYLEQKEDAYALERKEDIAFKKMLDVLPAPLRLLGLLREVGDYETLHEMLKRYVQLDKTKQQALADLIAELSSSAEVATVLAAHESMLKHEGASFSIVNKKPAEAFQALEEPGRLEAMLTSVKGWFGKAPKSMKNDRTEIKDVPLEYTSQLLKQRAFLIRLSAYLKYSNLQENDPLFQELESHYALLESNLNNALLNTREEVNMRDFERIQQELEARKEELANNVRVGEVGLQNGAGEKAVALSASAIYGMWFVGAIGAPLATALAGSTIAAIWKDVRNKSDNIADQIMLPRTKLASAAQPLDYAYVERLDQLFGVETGVSQRPVLVTPMTATKLLQSAANTVVDEVVTKTGKKVQEAVAAKVKNEFAYEIQAMEEITEMVNTLDVVSIKTSIFLTYSAGIALIITAIFPPLFPVFITAGSILGVYVIVAVTNLPAGKLADRVMRGAGSAIQGVIRVGYGILRPLFTFDDNARLGFGRAVLATITSFAAQIGFLVYAPLALPVVLISGLFGTIAGLAQGLGIQQVFSAVFSNPVVVASKNEQISEKIEIISKGQLSKEHKEWLDSIYPNFSQQLLKYLKMRVTDIEARIALANQSVPPNAEELAKISVDVEALEDEWKQIQVKIAATRPNSPAIFEFLKGVLREQYVAERSRYIGGAAVYKERAKRNLHFSDLTASKDLPLGSRPNFDMKWGNEDETMDLEHTDHEARRAYLRGLEATASIVNAAEKTFVDPEYRKPKLALRHPA